MVVAPGGKTVSIAAWYAAHLNGVVVAPGGKTVSIAAWYAAHLNGVVVAPGGKTVSIAVRKNHMMACDKLTLADMPIRQNGGCPSV